MSLPHFLNLQKKKEKTNKLNYTVHVSLLTAPVKPGGNVGCKKRTHVRCYNILRKRKTKTKYIRTLFVGLFVGFGVGYKKRTSVR